MTQNYTIRAREDFAHVELAPGFQISLETMQRLWSEVIPFCEQHDTHRVLIEGDRPTRAMRTIDAYDHGKFIAGLNGYALRIAFCLYDYEPDELSQVFTVIANSRINAVKFFSDLEQTFKWLRN